MTSAAELILMGQFSYNFKELIHKMSHAKYVRCRCLTLTVLDNIFLYILYGNMTVPNMSNNVNNIKGRPTEHDIKIQFSIRNNIPSPNFKFVCQKTRK
jgi:hypothetical protein